MASASERWRRAAKVLHGSTQPPDAPPDLSGKRIERRYRIERRLGAGRVGVVYRAEDLSERRPVALKVYPASVVPGDEPAEAMVGDMAAATRLAHASVVPVFDVGVYATRFLYTVEPLLAGRSVAQRLAESGPLAAELVTRVGIELSHALSALHRNQLLHLDLTPENVFLVRDPLGLERVAMTAPGARHVLGLERATEGDGQGCLARPTYLAPELVFGKPPDVTTDVYQLGTLLYELLTGVAPCAGADFAATVRQHVAAKPKAIVELRPETDAGPALQAVISHCLEKSSSARYASMNKLTWALEETLGVEAAGLDVHFVQASTTSAPPEGLGWVGAEDPADSTERGPGVEGEEGEEDELAAAVEVAAFRQRVGWTAPPSRAPVRVVPASTPPPLPEDLFDGDLRASDPPPSDPDVRAALASIREASIPALSVDALVDLPDAAPETEVVEAAEVEGSGAEAPAAESPAAESPEAEAPDPVTTVPNDSGAPWVAVKRTPLPIAGGGAVVTPVGLLGPVDPPAVDQDESVGASPPAAEPGDAPATDLDDAKPPADLTTPAQSAPPQPSPPLPSAPPQPSPPPPSAKPALAQAASRPPLTPEEDRALDAFGWQGEPKLKRSRRAGSSALWIIGALVVGGTLALYFLLGADPASDGGPADSAQAAPGPALPSEAPAPSADAVPDKIDEAALAAGLAAGRQALHRADWSAASEAFRSAHQAAPTNPEALAGLAQSAFQRERFDEAAAHGAAALALAPDALDYRLKLGMAYFKLDRFEEAAAQWRAVLELEPENATARRYLTLLDKRR